MVVPFQLISAFLLALTFVDVQSVKDPQNTRFLLDEENRRPAKTEQDQEPDWMKLCKCVKPALRKMQATIAGYTEKVSRGNIKRNSNYKAPALDEVIAKIKKIAHDCTKQPQCRCPKGYFKTNDGYHCLKISNEPVSCQEAVEACGKNANSRLAVAKDHVKLTDLADYIREIDPTDNSFYWIGLSYNHTDGGVPVWTWEDGSAASYSITKGLKNSVKKTVQLTILNSEEPPKAIERVAISKNYKGTHWKQETCLDRDLAVKHKYICEFLMFKLQIKAISAKPKTSRNHHSTGKVSDKTKAY